MPANKKYLTQSPWQRFSKITAGFFGGYLVTITMCMALSYWMEPKTVFLSLRFGGFILWAVLLILAFLAKSGWKVWGIYLMLSGLFVACIYVGKMYHPIF